MEKPAVPATPARQAPLFSDIDDVAREARMAARLRASGCLHACLPAGLPACLRV